MSRVKLSNAEATRLGVLAKKRSKDKRPDLTKGDLAAEAVIAWCRKNGYPEPKREYMFAGGVSRKWRFDLAWPLLADRFAVEINGGGWVQGRHNRGSSLEKEYEKLGHAAALGWRVIPVTYAMLDRGELWPLLVMAFGTA